MTIFYSFLHTYLIILLIKFDKILRNCSSLYKTDNKINQKQNIIKP